MIPSWTVFNKEDDTGKRVVRIVAGLLEFNYPTHEDKIFIEQFDWTSPETTKITIEKIKACMTSTNFQHSAQKNLERMADHNIYPLWIRKIGKQIINVHVMGKPKRTTRHHDPDKTHRFLPLEERSTITTTTCSSSDPQKTSVQKKNQDNVLFRHPTYWFTLVRPSLVFGFYTPQEQATNLCEVISAFTTDFIRKNLTVATSDSLKSSPSSTMITGAGELSETTSVSLYLQNLQEFSDPKDALKTLMTMTGKLFTPPPIELEHAYVKNPSQFTNQICLLFRSILVFLQKQNIPIIDQSMEILAYFVFFGLDMLDSYPSRTTQDGLIPSIGKHVGVVSSVLDAWLRLVVLWIRPSGYRYEIFSPYMSLLAIEDLTKISSITDSSRPSGQSFDDLIKSKIFEDSFPNRTTWISRFDEARACVRDKILKRYVSEQCRRLSSGQILVLHGNTVLGWCVTAIRTHWSSFVECLNAGHNLQNHLSYEDEDRAETWTTMAVLVCLIFL